MKKLRPFLFTFNFLLLTFNLFSQAPQGYQKDPMNYLLKIQMPIVLMPSSLVDLMLIG
ncbi:MAG: hypothetical protein J7K53_08385 [Bacteroidales bacterium]|nr:hypothetical protein [Bacteroidales bacterium]